MKPPFEIIEHPSDIGIEAHGSSMKELFSNAAKGLISIIAEVSNLDSNHKRSINISAIDRENMMVRWLSEILYLYDAKKFITADVKYEILSDILLKATVLGEPYSAAKHQLKLDVKAITYHQLAIVEKQGVWTARIFVDI